MKNGVRVSCMLFCSVLFLSIQTFAAEPIHIGLSAPLSGTYAAYGQMFQQAIELAIDNINGDGGVQGRMINVVIEDSEGEPTVAKRIARKFARNKKIVAVIGDFTSSASMAARPEYQRGELVQLSPTASHPSYAEGSPYSFGIIGTQQVVGPFSARMAVEKLGKRKIGVLYINNDWGNSSQQFFVDGVKELGAEITGIESYLEGTEDFSTQIATIMADQPDMLLLSSMTQDGSAIIKQVKEAGWNTVEIMGSLSFYSPELITLGGDAVEGVFAYTVFFPKDSKPEIQTFVAQYESRFNQTPDQFAAVAYDAVYLLAQAMQESTDRKAIRDALASIKDFNGVSGRLSFTPAGDVDRDYVLLQINNGEFTVYAK